MSYVWCLSYFLTAASGRGYLGIVHLGKFNFVDGLADASGTYLPGPTAPGVEI